MALTLAVRSLITPGGIATLVLVVPLDGVLRSRSSPLEGSQRLLVSMVTAGTWLSLITLEGSQQGVVPTRAQAVQVAHQPWRDRNLQGVLRTPA